MKNHVAQSFLENTKINESESMTALREVKEETGLDIHLFKDIKAQTRYSPRPGVIKDVIYFLQKQSPMISLNKMKKSWV